MEPLESSVESDCTTTGFGAGLYKSLENEVFFAWTVEQQGTVELMPEPYFKVLIHEKSEQLLF